MMDLFEILIPLLFDVFMRDSFLLSDNFFSRFHGLGSLLEQRFGGSSLDTFLFHVRTISVSWLKATCWEDPGRCFFFCLNIFPRYFEVD